MSVFSVPFVADSVARLLAGLTSFAPKKSRKFDDMVCRKVDVDVETRHGAVRCTIYRPDGKESEDQAVYVNAHGGGFVIPYPEQDDPWCRYLAASAGVVVVNVDYGVAPRSRYPIALDQLYDVLVWAAGAGRPWDGTRMCVGGQSAGGNLATGAARMALEKHRPSIRLQVLHYPVLDLLTASREKTALASKPLLRPWMGEVFDTAYLPQPEVRRSRYASPALGDNAEGIEGIAPALVVTAELDRLRAEGEAYAKALERAGSLAGYREVAGVDHGYNITGGPEEVVREVYDFIVEHVRRATAR